MLFLSQNFNPLLIFISLTLGSILGGFVSFYFGVFGADMILKNERGMKNVKKWMERWGNLSVFAASFFPIPFPFALLAILAGFLKMNAKSFFTAMIIGKSLKAALSISIFLWGINFLKFYHILI
jgi:membrane protein YqaA with SNARE-associated domain